MEPGLFNYSDLMQQYDIADEYELHNLLKKIWSDERGDVKFKKMPTIEIGKANRKEQLISLLLQYAPIDIEELANKYEEEYGVKAGTVRGSYLRDIEQYLCNRRYSIDYAALSEIQFDRMKNVLTNDFYVIEDVKNIYKREFPESDESLINPYTLKTLGFHVYSGYSGYIIKKTFSSATDYFNYILTNDDVIDIRKYNAVIRCIATFCQECYRLRSLYEIVEFLPLQYVNIRRLNEVGFNKTDLYEYCICVAEEYEKGEYFTISSIREKGFTHKLDELGFDEWFYSSILMEDHERFSFQRIGNTRIFLRGEPDCNMGKMFTWLLEKYQRIDLYDFIEIINDYYGIALAKERIIEIIDSTELYYDRIMEAIYIDYDTYFEEI